MDPLRELELLKLLKRPIPDYLYHYTSINGLRGIIESRSIWASMIHYLNDTAELRDAIPLCREILGPEFKEISDLAKEVGSTCSIFGVRA